MLDTQDIPIEVDDLCLTGCLTFQYCEKFFSLFTLTLVYKSL